MLLSLVLWIPLMLIGGALAYRGMVLLHDDDKLDEYMHTNWSAREAVRELGMEFAIDKVRTFRLPILIIGGSAAFTVGFLNLIINFIDFIGA